MEYYTAEKANDILKWMDLERQISYVLTHMRLLDIKQKKKSSLQFTIPENLDNKENPKRDMHGSNLHG